MDKTMIRRYTNINSKYRNYLLLTALIILGIIYKLLNAYFNIVAPDESLYTYDSYLILKGDTPFIDYSTRAPVLLYMLVPFIKVFGTSIFASRLLSFTASIITILFVYKIGESLYNRNIGILASLVFIFSPCIAYWGCEIITEPTQVMFVTIAMYSLILGFKTNKYKYFLLNGIFLLLAILVRRTAAIFIISELFFIALLGFAYNCYTIKESFKKIVVVFSGLLLPCIPGLIYLMHAGYLSAAFSYLHPGMLLAIPGVGFSSYYSLILTELGSRSLYIALPTFLFLIIAINPFISERYRFWYKLYVFIIGLIFLGVLLQNILTYKLLTVIFNATIIVPILLILLSDNIISRKLDEHFGKSYKKSLYALSAIYIALILFIYIVVSNLFAGYTIWSLQETTSLFLTILFIALIYPAITLAKSVNIGIDNKNMFPHLFLMFWFFSIFLFYFVRNALSPVYLYEYAAVASIMTSVFFYYAYKGCSEKTKKAFYAFILLLVISVVFAQAQYAIHGSPASYGYIGTQQPISTVRDVGNYIASHTSEDEEIFTPYALYAFQADRNICFNMVRAYRYQYSDSPYSNYPTIEQLIVHLESEKIRYVIVDPRYMRYSMFEKHPELEEYVYSHYALEAQFKMNATENVDIYRRIETSQWKKQPK